MGSFTLSTEHLELSYLAGVTRWQLVEDRLNKIEEDLGLIPESLVVYFYEGNLKYNEFWYTEARNIDFLLDFEMKLYSFGKVDPTNN